MLYERGWESSIVDGVVRNEIGVDDIVIGEIGIKETARTVRIVRNQRQNKGVSSRRR